MRSPRALLLPVLAAGLALGGCTGHTASDDAPATTFSAEAETPVATATPVPVDGPVAAFQSWWTAVRSADTVAACGALTEALQQRMIAEYTATTGAEVGDCATLIRQTSALYAAAGMTAEVDVAVASETADTAVLEVTYATGDCGTVHLERPTSTWMLTAVETECAAG